MRASEDVQSRIDELADKCNEGQLTADERAQYEMFVWICQYEVLAWRLERLAA